MHFSIYLYYYAAVRIFECLRMSRINSSCINEWGCFLRGMEVLNRKLQVPAIKGCSHSEIPYLQNRMELCPVASTRTWNTCTWIRLKLGDGFKLNFFHSIREHCWYKGTQREAYLTLESKGKHGNMYVKHTKMISSYSIQFLFV